MLTRGMKRSESKKVRFLGNSVSDLCSSVIIGSRIYSVEIILWTELC